MIKYIKILMFYFEFIKIIGQNLWKEKIMLTYNNLEGTI